MDDRTNTIAGWVLAGCGAALGLSIVGGMIFHGERPEKMGYVIEGVEEEGAGGAAAEVPIASLLGSADAAKGAEVFKKCAACHTVNQGGANGVGPNLYATMGEALAAGKGGFAFSDALKKVGGTWDWEKMNAWLTSPRKFAPGTKMTFAGLSNPQDRANVILYLNQQGSNLPLPAAPAAGASPAEGGAAPGGDGAAPGAANAVDAVESDVRGATGDIANTGTPASGAPSVDPNAAREAAGRGN
ncbi:c-type cytochrome [Sphingomonas sp.]|jgi:cytochrome c|uniref:c-type cytochrome n=1 Tax=Sphingomonas sp. TaxID=28214 RepID=UPI0035C86029